MTTSRSRYPQHDERNNKGNYIGNSFIVTWYSNINTLIIRVLFNHHILHTQRHICVCVCVCVCVCYDVIFWWFNLYNHEILDILILLQKILEQVGQGIRKGCIFELNHLFQITLIHKLTLHLYWLFRWYFNCVQTKSWGLNTNVMRNSLVDNLLYS